MLILGIKSAPKQIRYALLSKSSDGVIDFLNRSSENRLKFPLALESSHDKRADWLYRELKRICDHNTLIEAIAVKLPEFNQRSGDTSEKRLAAYSDSIIFLTAGQRNLPLKCFNYTNFGRAVSSSTALSYAEEAVGRTAVNWDVQMADALLAAKAAIT